MKISHFIYKVDDIHQAVVFFEKLGFNVSLGKTKNPYNALIYFQDGSYIELIENMNLTLLIRIILRLIGKRKFVQGLEFHEKAPEGFIRFSFHANDTDELSQIKTICRAMKKKISSIAVSRRDPFGNHLSCHCVFPFDHNLPFFNTKLKGGESLWKTEHPNKIVGIKSIKYSSPPDQINFIKQFDPEKKFIFEEGNGGVTYMDFKYEDDNQSNELIFKNSWQLI